MSIPSQIWFLSRKREALSMWRHFFLFSSSEQYLFCWVYSIPKGRNCHYICLYFYDCKTDLCLRTTTSINTVTIDHELSTIARILSLMFATNQANAFSPIASEMAFQVVSIKWIRSKINISRKCMFKYAASSFSLFCREINLFKCHCSWKFQRRLQEQIWRIMDGHQEEVVGIVLQQSIERRLWHSSAQYIKTSWSSSDTNQSISQLQIPSVAYCGTFLSLASKEDENLSTCGK